MAATYISINLASFGGSDTKKVKVSIDDTAPGYLEDKVVVGSDKLVKTTIDPGLDETLELDIDQTKIDHDLLLNHEIDQHRVLDDASTTSTSLWSSTKIQDELDTKVDKVTSTDNAAVKFDGITGDVQDSGVIIDDSNNVTGINDLTIDGDLTVNGTTTSVNSDTLDVVDANITVNVNGDEASADLQHAGITVEMSDATNCDIGFDSSLASKFHVGEVGAEAEVVTVSHTQSLSNKSLDADNNTISNLETDNLKAGVLVTDLDTSVDNTKLAGAQAVKDYVIARVAEKDDASEITYTPADLADWDSSTDPGNVDGGLDQLAERATDAESALSTHLDGGAAKHTASSIANTPSGNLAATNQQDANNELQSDIDTRALDSDLTDHINDASDAHDSAAITNTPAGNILATTTQAAINELDSEKYAAANFDGDFDTRLATKDTDDLSEGATNKYATQAQLDKVDFISVTQAVDLDDVESKALSALQNGDNISELSNDSAFVDASGAQTAAVVNSTAGNETVQAPSVAAMRAYVGVTGGDLSEGSFAFSDNISSLTDITGFAFANGDTRSFDAIVSVDRAGDSLFEEINIRGIQKAGSWEISYDSVGDDSGIEFDITASGQLQYTSSDLTSGGTLKFRAKTTSL